MVAESTLTAIILLLCGKTYARKCTNAPLKSSELASRLVNNVQSEYTCPGENDPDVYVECCWDGTCCAETHATNEVDGLLFRLISICVITICLCLSLLLLLCCFWSRCPLYNTCRANYNSSQAVMYSLADEDDPLRLMPNEDTAGGRFVPTKVKMRIVDEV